jgi:transcriptional regulator with XRE-family HTH domain
LAYIIIKLIIGRRTEVAGVTDFGKRLRELRKKAGLTLRGLADRMDIDFTYITKLENDVMPPPNRRLFSASGRS